MRRAKFNPAEVSLTELGKLDPIDINRASWIYRPEAWRLSDKTIITSEGKTLVERYPNVNNTTLKRLFITDRKLLSEEDLNFVINSSAEEIIEEAFMKNNAIGMAHLSLCITSDFYQSMSKLIETFANDKKIPYLLSAIYISAYIQVHKLCYYTYSPDQGYDIVEWTPSGTYIPPTNTMPPILKYKQIKPVSDVTPYVPSSLTIQDCPLCHSAAITVRFGKAFKKWHVCCENPECQYYTGIEAKDTEDEAIIAWNTLTQERSST